MNSLSVWITIVACASLSNLEIVHCDQLNLQPFSFEGVNNVYNARIHRQSRFQQPKSKQPKSPFSSLRSHHTAGVKGHAIINGEYVETNRILMQKPTPRGVAYYPYGNPKVPVFIRAVKEVNKKYVLFQDPYLPPGEGYLVVLKKMPLKASFETQRIMNAVGTISASMVPVPTEIPYEAFHLHLSNNIHGTFDRLNIRKFAYGIRTRFASRKKARRRWLSRRKMKARARRRFSIGRWRGKRSVDVSNVLQRARTSRKEWNPCFITPLNITRVRLQIKNLAMHSTMNYTLPPRALTMTSNDDMDYDDFDYLF